MKSKKHKIPYTLDVKTEADAKVVLDLLEKLSEPTEKIKIAFRKYKQFKQGDI